MHTSTDRALPADGSWPCQTRTCMRSLSEKGGPPYRQMTSAGVPISERMIAFLYRLVRDGATSPGDVEEHCLQAMNSTVETKYTNPGLESYARSLAAFLTESE